MSFLRRLSSPCYCIVGWQGCRARLPLLDHEGGHGAFLRQHPPGDAAAVHEGASIIHKYITASCSIVSWTIHGTLAYGQTLPPPPPQPAPVTKTHPDSSSPCPSTHPHEAAMGVRQEVGVDQRRCGLSPPPRLGDSLRLCRVGLFGCRAHDSWCLRPRAVRKHDEPFVGSA